VSTAKMQQMMRTPPPPAKVTQAFQAAIVPLKEHVAMAARKKARKRTTRMAKEVKLTERQASRAAGQIMESAVEARRAGADALAAHLSREAESMVREADQYSQRAAKLQSYGKLLETGQGCCFSAFGGFMETPVPSQKFVFGLSPGLLRLLGAVYVGYRTFQAYGGMKEQPFVEAGLGAAAGAYAPVLASLGAAVFLEKGKGVGKMAYG
jgi:hypothetical protein